MFNFGVSYNIEVNNISIMSFLYSCIQIWWTNNSNYQNIIGYNTFIHIINKQWLSTSPCISPVRQYINSISIDQYMTHLQVDLFTYTLCLYTHMIKLHMIAIKMPQVDKWVTICVFFLTRIIIFCWLFSYWISINRLNNQLIIISIKTQNKKKRSWNKCQLLLKIHKSANSPSWLYRHISIRGHTWNLNVSFPQISTEKKNILY